MKPPSLTELEHEAVSLRRQIRSLGRQPTPEEHAAINVRAARIRQGIADQMVDRLITNRAEVVSTGTPVAGKEAKRGLDEARTRLKRKPEFRQAESRCPAADVSRAGEGVRVHCRVENSFLTSEGDPQSVLTFCMGSHEDCPSWQAEREAEWTGRKLRMAS